MEVQGCSRSLEEQLNDVRDENQPQDPTKGYQENRIFIVLDIFNIQVKALLDTGASKSYINSQWTTRLEDRGVRASIDNPHLARTANGAKVAISTSYRIVCKVKGRALPLEVYVLPGLTQEIILGMDTLRAWNISLDMAHGKAYMAVLPNRERPLNATDAAPSGLIQLLLKREQEELDLF